MALSASAILLFLAPTSRAELGLLLNPGAFSSLGTLNLTTPGVYTIDTSGSPVLRDASNNVLFTGTTYNQGGTFNSMVSVMAFTSITVAPGVTIRMSGANPLALLSTGDATFQGLLDASGQRGQDNPNGAGGVGGPGGGTGGSRGQTGDGPGGGSPKGGLPAWGLGAGYGGRGGDPSGILPFEYAPTYGDLSQYLQGGSGGGGTFSNLFGPGAGGGGGGGGLMLGACGVLNVGGTVNAGGGDGGGGLAIQGGGGSGGGLIFYAPTVNLIQAVGIYANGSTFAGGGRILFLTDTGAVGGAASVLTVNPGPTGNAGVGTIDYGILIKGQAPPPVAVPEPASLASAVLGALALISLKRRRRNLAR